MTGKEKIIEVASKRKVFRVEDTGVAPNSARKNTNGWSKTDRSHASAMG